MDVCGSVAGLEWSNVVLQREDAVLNIRAIFRVGNPPTTTHSHTHNNIFVLTDVKKDVRKRSAFSVSSDRMCTDGLLL